MPHKFPVENWERLLQEERSKWQSISLFLEKTNPQKEEIWADIGCGPGYFTLPIAERVKKVYAVDIHKEMIEICKKRAQEKNIKNIVYLLSSEEKIPAPTSSCHKVLLANVFHELLYPEKFLEEIKRILLPQGILYLIDWHPIESPTGPPIEERIPEEKVISFFHQHGGKLLEKFPIYPYHYFLAFSFS